MIPRETIEDIRARTDCVDLARDLGIVGRRGRELPRRNKVSACCPAHEDDDPSATVFVDGWTCHACGAGGDAIELVRSVRHCEFVDAVAELAGRLGVEVEDTVPPDLPAKRRRRRQRAEARAERRRRERAEEHRRRELARPVYQWLLDATVPLRDDQAASDYLVGERCIPLELADRAGVRVLCLATYRRRWANARRSGRPAGLEAAGLVTSRGGPHPWWGVPAAIVFPFVDEDGVSHIRWRRLDDAHPKTLAPCNPAPAPAAPYLAATTYEVAIRDGTLFVVEGELDALSLLTVGAPAVARGSKWVDEWCDEWTDIRRVFVLGDGDAGGSQFCRDVVSASARRLGRTWSRRLDAYQFPNGMDANDALRGGWLASFLKQIRHATDAA